MTTSGNLITAMLEFATSRRYHRIFNDPRTRPPESFFVVRRLGRSLARLAIELGAELMTQKAINQSIVAHSKMLEDEIDRLEDIIRAVAPEKLVAKPEDPPVGSLAWRAARGELF